MLVDAIPEGTAAVNPAIDNNDVFVIRQLLKRLCQLPGIYPLFILQSRFHGVTVHRIWLNNKNADKYADNKT
ncbi:hypothetical protein D3C77_391360 [compost metagenome]